MTMKAQEHNTDRRAVFAAAASGVVGAVAVLWLLHLHRLPLGVRGQWVWQVRPRPGPPTPGLAAGALIVFLAALAIFDACRRETVRRWQAAGAVAALSVGSYMMAIGSAASAPGGWVNATLAVCSDLSFGYFSEALRIDDAGGLRTWLGDPRRTNPGIVPARVATHPPGPVLAVRWAMAWLSRHAGIERLLSFPFRLAVPTGQEMQRLAAAVSSAHPKAREVMAAAALVWLLALGAPVAVLGTVTFGAALGGWRVGLGAGALAATIPALHVFMPGIDAWAAALAVWALAAVAWGCRTGRWQGTLVGGLLWGLGLQWTYGLAALAPIVVWLLWRGEKNRWVSLAALKAAGGAAAPIPLFLVG